MAAATAEVEGILMAEATPVVEEDIPAGEAIQEEVTASKSLVSISTVFPRPPRAPVRTWAAFFLSRQPLSHLISPEQELGCEGYGAAVS
jgi:hypothetical protein